MKTILLMLFVFSSLYAELLVKDVAKINDERVNYFYGKGIVIGLPGTGDKGRFSFMMLKNLLNKEKVDVSNQDVKSKNIATVMITAEINAFAKKGQVITATVSTIGDAKSIEGGELIVTALKSANGDVFAICQGSLTINQETKTKGSLINKCTVERELEYNLKDKLITNMVLVYPSIETAYKVEKSINKEFGVLTATALDSSNVQLRKPETMSSMEFLYRVQNLSIGAVSDETRIVLDSTNKIIISGAEVELPDTVITTSGFSVRIKQAAISDGDSMDKDIRGNLVLNEKNGVIRRNGGKPTLGDLIHGLKIMKVPFNEIIAVVQGLEVKGLIKTKVIIK